MTIIKTYIKEYLTPRLLLHGLKDVNALIITSDVEKRLVSLISRWNDLNFRQTLLITGIEEAAFYEPDCSLETKALVVLAIRNSLIEDISSTKEASRKYGLVEPVLNDIDIKDLTKEAVKFFGNVNLAMLADEIQNIDDNLYEILPVKYPVAWNALSHLSVLRKKYKKFEQIIQPKIDFDKINYNYADKKFGEVLSGVNPDFTLELQEILSQIVNNKNSVLFSDCFKMLTRHPEKLLKIIEIVLRSNAAIVTFNYYISNGYIAKRDPLLRPGHSSRDLKRKFENMNGLTKTHHDTLKILKESYDKK